MRNQDFNNTTDADRLQKLDGVIRDRTNRMLTDDQIQALVNSIEPGAQHTILVYSDPCEFSGALSARRNEDMGWIVFGPAQFAKSLTRSCFVGILEDPEQPAAAVIIQSVGGRLHYFAHIYLPQSFITGGCADE